MAATDKCGEALSVGLRRLATDAWEIVDPRERRADRPKTAATRSVAAVPLAAGDDLAAADQIGWAAADTAAGDEQEGDQGPDDSHDVIPCWLSLDLPSVVTEWTS